MSTYNDAAIAGAKLLLEEHSHEMILRVFEIMERAKQHTFQVLTKRPERMLEFLGGSSGAGLDAPPLPNVWLGVSTENQETANERIPLLVQAPAAKRFISAEPLLGAIDFYECGSRGGEDGDPFAFNALRGADGTEPPIPGIDWVIVGGESGRDARGCNLYWIDDIVRACDLASVPVFVKQLGARPYRQLTARSSRENLKLHDSHGGDPDEWPRKLRVREFPA